MTPFVWGIPRSLNSSMRTRYTVHTSTTLQYTLLSSFLFIQKIHCRICVHKNMINIFEHFLVPIFKNKGDNYSTVF